MMVKVCGITNREDAAAAVEAGVSALGFIFYPRSPRYLNPEAAAQIIETLPDSIWSVGVFANEQPDEVERIEVWTHPRRLEHTNRPEPKSDLDAKFSVQYCMVRALLDRRIAIEHFEGRAYEAPAARKLLPRVHAAPYTTAQFPADNHFGAEVRVALRGGKALSAKVDQPFGRTSDNPLPAGLLKEKFENCAARVLPRERASGKATYLICFAIVLVTPSAPTTR